MTTTNDDALPMRPRGAERRAANAAAARTSRASRPFRSAGPAAGPSQSSGAAVSPPAAPEPTRRGRRVVPMTATAVAACLFVTVASPQSALATPTDAVPERSASIAAMDAQEYRATGSVQIEVDRDGFSVERAPSPVSRGILGAALPAGTAVVRPVDGSVPAAGGFGSRWVAGCRACSTNHEGLDFAAPIGTPAIAAMSGVVVSAGVLGGYGNQVLVQHADGLQTRYGHLSRIAVRVGQVVTAGERVGEVGNTGVSTGPHLHFEVIVSGRPVDPAVWLRARGLL
jgi:murein DD-endopeptidase MepM/ murein hydrolase activator NlpD